MVNLVKTLGHLVIYFEVKKPVDIIPLKLLSYSLYVTVFAKTVPIGTTIEIHFMA